MKEIIFRVGLAVLLLLSRQTQAQTAVAFKSKANDSVSMVYIWHADTLRQISKDSSQIQSLYGHVKLQQGKTFFYCDSVAMNQKDNTIEAYGNVHINDNDSTNIYSQYMKYFVVKKNITFQKKVSLTDGKGTLTTENLNYDLNGKIGTYTSGGRIVNGSTVVTSGDGIYYGDTKDAHFKKNVILNDPAYDLKSDSLVYNTESKIATFITRTLIRDSSGRTIVTKAGFYDLKNHRAQFPMRPEITDKSQYVTGDSVQFDDSTGISTAQGNALYRDTSQGISIIAGLLIADKKNNTLFATQKPVMILKEDKDSIYVTADTLFSGKYPDSLFENKTNPNGDSSQSTVAANAGNSSDSSKRYLQGFHHVRIFSDSLQAVSDSLYYSGIDSVFQLFQDPVVWSGSSQVTGDTIYLYTKNKKPEHLYVFENSMVVNKTGESMYNQIKAHTLNGYFKDGAIDHMRAKGSAESIYYIKDDSMALVGVNRVNKADIIDMIFLDKELNRVILRNDADGTVYPIRKVNNDEMRLRSFKWLDARRPKTKFEILQ
jgi:lipopolysaccharide export system protein LptA